MTYFKEGTPEEWLIFMDRPRSCITGQNTTTGVAKFALARRLLDRATKTVFENTSQLNGGTTTNASFLEWAVTEDVFPPKDLLNQKQFMCCFLRKPEDAG